MTNLSVKRHCYVVIVLRSIWSLPNSFYFSMFFPHCVPTFQDKWGKVFSDTSISPFLHVAYVFTILYNITYVYIYIYNIIILFMYITLYIYTCTCMILEKGGSRTHGKTSTPPLVFHQAFLGICIFAGTMIIPCYLVWRASTKNLWFD